MASPIAFKLDFREMAGVIDSGRSKGGGGQSMARPRGPSGEACTDELVVGKLFSGDMMGDACRELVLVMVEALTDAADTEKLGGRKLVCTREICGRPLADGWRDPEREFVL